MTPTTIDAAPAVATRQSPYRGLVPYEQDDMPYFRGRQQEVEAVFERLFASRLTLVYGASGSGKSSILRAGVMSRLKEHDLTVPVLVTGWHDDPITIINEALDDVVERQADESVEDRLRRAVDATQQYVMVILDQFEEMLRDAARAHDNTSCTKLFDVISSLTMSDGGVSFVLALRADALADVDVLLRRLPNGLVQSYRVRSMTDQHASEAIREPIDVFNEAFDAKIVVEDTVVTAVIADVSSVNNMSLANSLDTAVRNDVDLPFLQIVMSRLWEAERVECTPPSDVLRWTTLQRLGGSAQILRDHVNRILDRLSIDDRRIASLALSRLITPTGAKVPYSARDLSLLTEIPERDVDRVLDELASGQSRLLRTVNGSSDQVLYELFHDRLSSPIARWARRERELDVERKGEAYRRRVLAWVIPIAIAAAFTIGLVASSLNSDDGPPLAKIASVEIPSTVGDGLPLERLFDGDESKGVEINVGTSRQFKIVVVFDEEIDIVDAQVVPAEDGDLPQPMSAYIAETRIDIPVGDVRPVGRGAFGRTKRLTLIIEAQEVDPTIQIAELKFWRVGS